MELEPIQQPPDGASCDRNLQPIRQPCANLVDGQVGLLLEPDQNLEFGRLIDLAFASGSVRNALGLTGPLACSRNLPNPRQTYTKNLSQLP